MSSSTLNNLHSTLVTVLRGGRGFRVRNRAVSQPAQLLHLYEFESCPYCRKVREVFSEMDLSYLAHPCAKGGKNRAIVRELGGKEQFPFLVDDNTGRQLYESEDIISYLAETYGAGRPRSSVALSPVNTVTAALSSAVRWKGRAVSGAGRAADKPLLLYNFEASPYCRKVREVLSELDLDTEVRNVAKGGKLRLELVARGGRMMVPYLVDPNTNVEMYESDKIIGYLRQTYGT